MLRRRLDSARAGCASHIALAVAVASLVALPASTGTAIALDHSNHGDGPNGTIPRDHGDRGHDNGRNRGNSAAVAVNTTDHSIVFDLTFAILRVTGGVVDNQNVAAAYASCNGCQTVAISIQTLLVQGVANVVAPINEASARNQNCQQCDTVAIAYQFVVAPGTTLKFTPEGRQEVAYIRHQLERLRQDALRNGITGPQIVLAVAALMNQYATILGTQLVPTTHPSAGGNGGSTAGATPPAAATSSTEATSSAAGPGVSTTTSTATPPTSSTAPAGASGAAAGTTPSVPTDTPMTSTITGTAPTTTGTTPTTTGTTPTTTGTTPTTTGTTGVSGGATTTGTSGTTTTPVGGTTTTSGATTATSSSTTPTTP